MKYSSSIVITALDKATRPIRGISRALSSLQSNAAMRSFGTSVSRVQNSIGNVSKEAGLLAARLGGIAAVGGFAFKNLFLDTAMEFERYQTILYSVEKDNRKVAKAMDWVSTFAAKTPYELGEVTDAYVKLRVYGIDPVHGVLESLGNTSSAMGKPLMQAVEAIADAMTGENERLKEFGITTKTVGKKVTYSMGDIQRTVQKGNRLQIQGALKALMDAKFSGAMVRQSKTLNGLVSNLSDTWTRFANKTMSGGAFAAIKGEIGGFLDWLNKKAEDGTMDRWARSINNGVVKAIKELHIACVQAKPVIEDLGNKFKWAKDHLGGYGGLLKATIFLMAVPFVASVATATASVLGLGIQFIGLVPKIGAATAALRSFSTAAAASSVAGDIASLGGGQLKGLAPKGYGQAAGKMGRFGKWFSKVPVIGKLAGAGAALGTLGGKVPMLGKAAGGLGKIGGAVGKKIPWLGAGLTAWAIGDYLKRGDTKGAAGEAGGFGGFLAGSAGGAAAGGAIGSAFPVVGTAAGAGVGALIGGLSGSGLGDWIGRAVVDAVEKHTKEAVKPKKDELSMHLKVDVINGTVQVGNVQNRGDSKLDYKLNMGLMTT